MRYGVLFLAILLSLGISLSTPITNCTEISSSGTYELTQNVYNTTPDALPISALQFACIRISASDVSLDCQGYSISGRIAANRQYGVLILSRTAGTLITNVTVKNCAAIMNYSNGIYCYNESGFAFQNNTVFSLLSSNSYGIGLNNCSNGLVDGNTVSNTTATTTSSHQAAIMLRFSSNNNTIANNLVENFNATSSGGGPTIGIDLYYVSGLANTNNTIANNTLSNIRHGGIVGYDGSNRTVIINNSVSQILNGQGIALAGASARPILHSRIVNNTVFNTSADCIRLDYPSNATVANNSVSMCRGSGSGGIFVQSMNNSFILNNSVYNSSRGLRLQGTLRTLIRDNILGTGDMQGIFLSLTSANDNITNNTVYNYTLHGIHLSEGSNVATNHKVSNNTVYNNSQHGIYVYFGNNNDFRNNTVFNNSQNGIRAEFSNTNNITQCRIFNNSGNGISIIGWTSANIGVVNQTYLSNNGGVAIYFEGTSGMNHRLAGVILDGPSGDMSDYANLSMNDSVSSTSSYSFNWSDAPPSPPIPAFGKFVNITRISGTIALDSIVWHWLDSELAGHNESIFMLYRYNGSGWTNVTYTLNTTQNSIAVAGLTGFSDFGILENYTATGEEVTLFGVNVTNQSLPRWEGSSFAGNFSTAPGNLTFANISASMLTDRWAAFYGNISVGDIILADESSNLVYSWVWDAGNDGIICVSTNGSVSTFEAFPGLKSDVDAAWGFSPADPDSANNTFTGTNCTLQVGPVSISESDYADTGYPGDFLTCLLKMAPAPDKDELLFCTMTQNDVTLWNDELGDFELLVPTPYAPGPSGYETYYFYMASAG